MLAFILLICYCNIMNRDLLKVQDGLHEDRASKPGLRQKIGSALLATILVSGCAGQESTRAASKPSLNEDQISALREAPVVDGMPQNERTRAATCGIEAVRAAVAGVLKHQEREVNDSHGTYFSEPDNLQSSHVRVMPKAPGVSELTLEVAITPSGEVFDTAGDESGFNVRGNLTMMDGEKESWVEALSVLRPDQAGFPNGGIAVWDLQNTKGGTVNDPQTICDATETLKAASR